MCSVTSVGAAVCIGFTLVTPAHAQTVADPERFKRAIDEYVARTSVDPRARPSWSSRSTARTLPPLPFANAAR